MPQRIYLDNAATSWPKPECVYRAVDQFQRENGAAAGRGNYRTALESGRIVEQARAQVAEFIGAVDAHRIVFTLNGTDALHLAIDGLLQPGDHVVTTVTEHNSVLRPLHAWEQRGVGVTYVPCNAAGYVDPADISLAVRRPTRLVAVCHASNVTGAVQPLVDIARIAKSSGALLLVDAAQSLGHVEVRVEKLPIDLLAAPGHKGLLGPLGTGFLYVAPGVERQLRPVRLGGTGTNSESLESPAEMPQRYEAGNLNVPALAGLAAGIQWIRGQTLERIVTAEQALARQLIAGLEALPGVRIVGPTTEAPRVGVISVVVSGYDPQELAVLLESMAGVEVRSGLHCAALVHRHLDCSEQQGTLRFSLGALNTTEQVNTCLCSLASLLGTK